MILRLALVSLALLTTACAATTPLMVAQAGGHQVARYEEDIKVRTAAALKDEPDLLTYSSQAIGDGKTEEAVETYMKGYEHPDFTMAMKSLALYQIGLIYMNRFNDDRNDDKAREYFQLHRQEFPGSQLSSRIQARLEVLENRGNDALTIPAKELLSGVDREALLARPNQGYDDELNPMSERAISQNRTAEAETVYLIVYDNEASGEDFRSKSLYQLGLIYMSPFNKSRDRIKALGYFRKIVEEFPNSKIRNRAEIRITEMLNNQG
ncbi:MAG: tetratricopeptide repeat protein [Oleibacter sp.]|nr:tetratricopeptide repeat protein [Thalassolituus sp.]